MIFNEEPVLIAGFPIPPPDNRLKCPVRRWKKGGGSRVLSFIDSPEYTEFKSNVNVWWMHYNPTYTTEFAKLLEWTKSGKVLGVVCDFRVHHGRLWTKDGRPKVVDAPNRLKGLHDTFTKLVGFDDTLFFKTEIEKVEIPENRRECFYLRIGPITPRKELG